MNLQNKVAIVTGASTGIGKALSMVLSSKGVKVLLLARSVEKLEKIKSEIEATGGQASVYKVDLSNREEVISTIDEIKKLEERIDVIANIAGIWHSAEEVFAGTDYEKFDSNVIINTIEVGITAPMLIVHGLINQMPKGSHIINLSGTFEDGAKGWLPYYVSKKALEDFTIGLSEEVKNKDIFVNCISPSDTATEEYIKWFPQYAEGAQTPEDVVGEILSIIEQEDPETGKIKEVKG